MSGFLRGRKDGKEEETDVMKKESEGDFKRTEERRRKRY